MLKSESHQTVHGQEVSADTMGEKSFNEDEKKEHSSEGAPHLQSRSKACSFSSLPPIQNTAAKNVLI